MSYPSTIATLTNPLATQKLNAPSHSGIETSQNTEITAVETFIGAEGNASTVGTLIYDVRSPASNGGGHVQTANKGGTGQTSFQKGDIFAAQSTSVLSKLAIGSDGQILASDSTAQIGVRWIDNSRAKVSAVTSTNNPNVQGRESSLFSVVIPASTLGTSNAIRSTVYISSWNPRSSILVKAIYGGNVVSSIFNGGGTNNIYSGGQIRYTLIANNSSSVQGAILELDMKAGTDAGAVASTSSFMSGMVVGNGSVQSDASQNFGLTLIDSNGGGPTLKGYIVEKIN